MNNKKQNLLLKKNVYLRIILKTQSESVAMFKYVLERSCGVNIDLVASCTLKFISTGTPKTIYFPFVTNGKLMHFVCSNI